MIIMTIKTGGGDAVDGHDHEASGEDGDDYDDDVDEAGLVPSMGVQVEGERLVSTLLINNAVEVIIKDHDMMMVITDH